MSSAVTPRPAGRPSTITPSERPCDSPAVRNLSTLSLGGLADLVDVAPQLGDETVHALETHLTADPRVERDLGVLAVEVAVEVEQVGLDQERAALGIEGGAAADRDRRHVVAGAPRLGDGRRRHAAEAVERPRADALDLDPRDCPRRLEQRKVAAA